MLEITVERITRKTYTVPGGEGAQEQALAVAECDGTWGKEEAIYRVVGMEVSMEKDE
jgi:hypothetical protein